MSEAISEIVSLLKNVLVEKKAPYHLHEPNFEGLEREMMLSCIEEGYVSYLGKNVADFEKKLAELNQVKHAIVVVNGTSALHALLVGTEITAGTEVLCPALTFVGTANAISLAGAIPHFVDCSDDSLNICPILLKKYLEKIIVKTKEGYSINKITGRRITALLPVHILGHPCNMVELLDIANSYSLVLIEDAAQSLGSLYLNKPLGAWGKGGILSFNGNKIITTGGGGAILTNDSVLAERLKHITSTAKIPHRWHFHHDQIAFNYRMPSLNATLGIAQLHKLPTYLEKKRKLSDFYQALFSDSKYWHFIAEPSNTRSNYWLNSVKLKEPNEKIIEATLEALAKHQIFCRPIWQLMHTLPMYRDCPKMNLDHAVKAIQQVLSLPSSPKLAEIVPL